METGLRVQWRQFSLLLLVNAFVGAMVGLERSVMPTLAADEFGIASATVVLTFIVSFGLVKALANLLTGHLADVYGRKLLLVVGWCIGLPVPLLIIWAPDWSWVVAANILLGVQQGLCWSAAVVMKIDLVGPKARGLATGLNEFTGYGAMALSTAGAGWLAATYGVRPAPFLVGIGFAVAGLLVSLFLVRETRQFAQTPSAAAVARPSFLQVFARSSWQDARLRSFSFAGLANNLNDVVVWGMLPLLATVNGVSIAETARVGAVYLGVWGVTQLGSGALSDRYGRVGFIVAGFVLQSIGIVLFGAMTLPLWYIAAAVMGLGTGMVYPTLLAAVGDQVDPAWRATGLGVYRFWRDLGYALGAVVAGLSWDNGGALVGITLISGITMAAGAAVLFAPRPVSAAQ